MMTFFGRSSTFCKLLFRILQGLWIRTRAREMNFAMCRLLDHPTTTGADRSGVNSLFEIDPAYLFL